MTEIVQYNNNTLLKHTVTSGLYTYPQIAEASRGG